MIFIDMDGTLAKIYEHKDYMEKMFERHFFENLKPYKWATDLNEWAATRDDVYILSACISSKWCEAEKRQWVHKYMSNIPDDRIILVPFGANKADAIWDIAKDSKINILIDDYSKNLYEWEEQGLENIGIKFINGINNKNGNSYSYKIKSFKNFIKTLDIINYI